MSQDIETKERNMDELRSDRQLKSRCRRRRRHRRCRRRRCRRHRRCTKTSRTSNRLSSKTDQTFVQKIAQVPTFRSRKDFFFSCCCTMFELFLQEQWSSSFKFQSSAEKKFET